LILDEAEDAGWVERNVARGRRTREPLERRRNRGVLDVEEFATVLTAASQLDGRHSPATMEKAERARLLRDHVGLEWKAIAASLRVAPTTAIYLYGYAEPEDGPTCGPRRAVIATLGMAGPRVGELCALNNQDVSLTKARFQIRDAKTDAGVRPVDIHPALLAELTAYLILRLSRLAGLLWPPGAGRRPGRLVGICGSFPVVLAAERGARPFRGAVVRSC
jgi:integrase